MKSKIVSLIKMIILSIGVIAVVALAEKKESDSLRNLNYSEQTEYDFAMGTSISVAIYDAKEYDKLLSDIFDEIKLLDSELISWREDDSELGRLNQSYTSNQCYEISDELYEILVKSLDVCVSSRGALDITLRPLADLWNIESSDEFVPPTQSDIETTLESVGYDNLKLVNDTNCIIINHKDMVIDLGAIGKGYALDKARVLLESTQVKGALVTVGGSILVYGYKAGDEGEKESGWRIGVRNPLKPNDTSAMMGYLEFPPGTKLCVSTSGNYEKYKVYDGKKYHHILDSNTGYPADSGLISVTVVCEDGLLSDALSTACFVLGYEQSVELLKKYDAEAVFMDSENRITVTDGLKEIWQEY